ncbi:TPA: hypothetical protein TXL48_000667 [Streptococcus suis]|nr:hypothetical protein [Streptococcus suis]HEM3970032.1 hypothetical protein [Streptococcus suis]HEM3982321.1 hypothetical protein [Streptococcus suis]
MKQPLMNSSISDNQAKTIYDKILNNFDIFDDRFYFKANQTFLRSECPEFGFFKTLREFAIPSRDIIKIIFTNDYGTQFIFTSQTYSEYKEFLSDTDQVDVIIIIEKQVKESLFSIYDYHSFFHNFQKLDIVNQLDFFSELLEGIEKRLIIQVYDEKFKGNELSTESLLFKYHLEDTKISCINRNVQLEKIAFVNQFYNFNQYKLIPEDFHILSGNFVELETLFNKFETIFSQIYVSRFAIIKYETLELSSSLSKNITEIQNINSISYQSEFYKIYTWIFSEGNYLDKLAIVQNVLFTKDFRFTHLDYDFNDINRIYNIYLSDKTEAFLNAKNDMGKFISTTLYEMKQYTNVIVGNISNNFFALIAFMVTTIIANIVSTSPLDNIFTKDILWILFFILVGSLIYCWLSNIKFKRDISNFYEIFFRLKLNYKELFSAKELDRIFSDKAIGEINRELEVFLLNINISWIGGIVALLIFVIYKLFW